MIKSEQRPMNAAERGEFEKIVREAGTLVSLKTPAQCFGAVLLLLFMALLGFLAGTLVVTLFYLISKFVPAAAGLSSPSAVKAFQWGGAVLGAAGIPLLLWAGTRKARQRYSHRLKDDLREGKVEVLHVTAADAVHRELVDGEQLFFIDAGDSQVLFLCGDYLAEPLSSGEFPSTAFELVRGIHSRIILEIKCLGKPFEARRMTLGVDDDCCFPIDGDVLTCGLDQLETALQKKK